MNLAELTTKAPHPWVYSGGQPKVPSTFSLGSKVSVGAERVPGAQATHGGSAGPGGNTGGVKPLCQSILMKR